MEIVVDTYIYKLHPNGGICRIFNETLPRLCEIDEQMKFLMLRNEISIDQIPPRHKRIYYSHYQQNLREFSRKEEKSIV